MADINETTNQQRDQQKRAVVVVVIARATAAVTTVTQQQDGAAMATVMDSNGRCNGNATIGKRLGEMILAPKRRDFDTANNMRKKLRNE